MSENKDINEVDLLIRLWHDASVRKGSHLSTDECAKIAIAALQSHGRGDDHHCRYREALDTAHKVFAAECDAMQKQLYAAGNPKSHESAPSDVGGASPGSSQGDGHIAAPAAPDALQALLNHPIAQAHGLTGRECKEFLKALRTTEPVSSEPPYEPGIVGIGNKLLREDAIKAALEAAKEQGAQFDVKD